MNLEKYSMQIMRNKEKRMAHRCKHKTICISIVLGFILMVFTNVDKESRGNDMIETRDPIVVEFPLRGEWHAPNTPGAKIPSHGTNKLGTRYAYDFIQVNWEKRGLPAYRVSLLHYLFLGVPLKDYYCWGQEVYAPCNGIVVQAKDGYKERSRTNIFSDTLNAYKNAHYFNPEKDDEQLVAGNYIITKYDDGVYAALCHLQNGSIQVSIEQKVKKGEFIGRIGNSGNSYAPHLHFQLMDSDDIKIAKGIPCAFEQYEIYQENEWKITTNGIPTDKDRIRFRQSNMK